MSQNKANPARPTNQRGLVGEGLAIAAITAIAYLCALAFRVGQMTHFGLPVTLAAVRLSDAAMAGLFVLVCGVPTLLAMDALESWRAGTVDKILRFTTWAMLLPLVAVVLAFLVVVGVAVAQLWGWLWGVAVAALLGAVLLGVAWFVVAGLLAASPKADSVTALVRRFPTQVVVVLLSTLLCISALMFGSAGIALPGRSYLRTVSTGEAAIAVFDDRVVLASIEPTASADATLTGAVRVVPLPSADASFSAMRIRRLHPPSGN